MLENSVVNFFITFGPIAFGAAFIYFGIPRMYASIRKIAAGDGYPDDTDHTVIRVIKLVGIIVLVMGAVSALTSPSVVPKNSVGDPAAQIRKIEDMNRQNVAPDPGQIVDKSRQPENTQEERKALFDAMVNYKK